jgi:hypothetical protein
MNINSSSSKNSKKWGVFEKKSETELTTKKMAKIMRELLGNGNLLKE